MLQRLKSMFSARKELTQLERVSASTSTKDHLREHFFSAPPICRMKQFAILEKWEAPRQ